MSRLQLPLKHSLRDPVDEVAIENIAQELAARWPTSHRPWRRVIGATAIATAVAALATFAVLRRLPGPLLLADGRTVAAAEARTTAQDLALADGSRIRLLPGARLEPLASSAEVFSAVVTQGRAQFDVRPGGPRHWTIECGLATVEVVGTSFDCERSPGRLRVVVRRGAVLVRGERVPDRARRLSAGETLEVVEAPATSPQGRDHGPAETPSSDQLAATAAAARASRESPAPRAAVKAWRELAQRGRHGEAFAMLGSEGVQREAKRLGIGDLLALADVARLSGHPTEAVAPLERILTDFAGDAQAPLAAFALGRLELDSLGRPKAAAAALQRALALGVPRSLREDVRARLVEAHAKSGDASAARAAAADYFAEFPAGRHARAIENWLRPR